MDEQTSERFVAVEGRVTAMETEVAVIQSNYVRKDETADRHSDLRDELAAIRHANQRACDENRALIERWRMESKADTAASEARCLAAIAAVKASNEASIAEVKASNQASIAEVKASNEASIAEVKASVIGVKASNETAIAAVKASVIEVKASTETAIAAVKASVIEVKASNETAIAAVRASVVDAKASNEASIAEVRHDVTKMGLRVIMWMVVLLTANSAFLLAALKEMMH